MKAETGSKKRGARKVQEHLQIGRQRAAPLQIRNVLVPLDFSNPSLKAIKFALSISKRFGAELHLVHVFAPNYPIAALDTIPLITPELEVRRNVRQNLKDVAREHGVELHRKNIHAPQGRPFEQICELARRIEIDLIVISTRGRTGLEHLVLGSTAERVVRYSPCPVLVVRGSHGKSKAARNGESSRQTTDFQKILVPIDFSECSLRGLAYAKQLAREFHSTLVLLHSVHMDYYVASDEYARYDFPLLMAQSEKAAKAQMRDLVRQTKREGFKVEASLQVGHPGDQICDRARDDHADLIVTSTHGRTGLKHILIGSTAEFVLRHARCPVLVVPTHKRPAITPTKARP